MSGKSFVRKALHFVLPHNPLGDRIYSTISSYYKLGRFPRFHNPISFNDHLFQIRVGREREELRKKVADKILVKDYVNHAVGERYILETIAVLESGQDVDNFEPPIPCVIKASHTSGDVLIIRDAHEFHKARVKGWLRRDYYLQHREWFYKDAHKRVLVEELLSDDGATPPDDFKVFCFNGVPKFIQIDQGRFSKHTRTLYTPDWRRLPVAYQYPAGGAVARPDFLDELLEVAARLAEPFTFIRVDALAANGNLKINELTNSPEAASGRFWPECADQKLGSLFTDADKDVLELLRD